MNIPAAYRYNKNRQSRGSIHGDSAATHDVFKRGLDELTMDAVDTVIELIQQNSLYRGQEFLHLVREFRGFMTAYAGLPSEKKDLFVWRNVYGPDGELSSRGSLRIRNTSIGTLLVNLSEGMDLEDAVARFESIVAPQNYKRTTALVTQAMVDRAKEKVDELGLSSALQRRYATIEDLDINNVLFLNREAVTIEEKTGQTDPFSGVANKGAGDRQFSKVEEITIDKFIADILPRARNIEVMVENRMLGNMMSLLTASDPTAGKLFKWDNPFSWSYNGDVTDSIKERVKKAGGNIDAELCCRLSWNNYDDLDLHMEERTQNGTNTIFYADKKSLISKGCLDVDMNAGRGTTRCPVENIYYGAIKNMPDGVYKLLVHQYSKRETSDVGFDVEIDILGEVHSYSYYKDVRNNERIPVAEIHKTDAGIRVVDLLKPSTAVNDVWGIKTQVFTPVVAITKSPNYWDCAQGNQHTFFFLKGCKPDMPARGFYNEFLSGGLHEHRKVFEIVGGKMRVGEVQNPLCGVGFSSTKRSSIVARVSGNFTRLVKIIF